MQRTAFIIMIIFLTGFYSFAQQVPRDLVIYKESINVNHITSQAIDTIQKMGVSRFNSITLNSSASQEDFEWVCEEFKGIKKIRIESTNESIYDLSKISFLDSLEQLIALHIDTSKENPIDLSIISHLTELNYLEFNSTKVTNTDALCGLPKLKHIGFYLSHVNSIDFLYHTPLVEVLKLHGMHHSFEDYKPIAGLKNLKELAIYMNPQAIDEKLETLKSLESLREIRMANCFRVTSLDFLENNKDLEEIHASWCHGLIDFTALSCFKNLKTLVLVDTKIKDLSDLEGINTLESVNFSDTVIDDISVLKNCKDLLYVNIKKTKVKDLSPLEHCKKLRRVQVSPGIPNLNQQIESLTTAIPNLEVRIKSW